MTNKGCVQSGLDFTVSGIGLELSVNALEIVGAAAPGHSLTTGKSADFSVTSKTPDHLPRLKGNDNRRPSK